MAMTTNRLSSTQYMQEILELTKILRKDGDKVLSGSSKLSLSTKLLHNLNDAFTLIIDESKDLESSFQVCNSSEIDLFRDLKFLHDFIQKTIWLKIVHTNSDSRISIDITKFRHLRYLELQKVCIEMVNGIQGVRGQLESICCTGGGGVGTIGRLLAACGGDDGVGFIWPSLKRLALPYNGLGRLDKSLELAPWLQTLDLSYNFISIATELDCLPSLKYVNLSYNKLETIPIFNKSTYRSLRVLVLKNNYIENIDGLQGLDFLAELDLSFNCLSDHQLLWPIETMTALLWLNLTGNPLSYHAQHRVLTSKYLHSSLAENKFILDHYLLSKMEKLIVSENRLFTIRALPTSSSSSHKNNLNSLIDSINNDSVTGSLINSLENNATLEQYETTNNSITSVTKNRRKTNVKEVCIADDFEQIDDKKSIDVTKKLVNSYVEISSDHLETKKKMLALREKFGDENWLSSHGGVFVQDIMGMESPVIPTNNPNILSVNSESCSLPKLLHSSEENYEQFTSNVIDDDSKTNKKIEKEKSMKEENYLLSNNNIMNEEKNFDSTSNYDPEKEYGELFLMRKIRDKNCDEMEEVFLIITENDIKEQDPITRKIKYRWSIDAILSCQIGREKLDIDFLFNTTRRDRQCRTYHAESTSDATKVVEIIGNSMKIQPLVLEIFKCMKCSTHFSQDCDNIIDITKMSFPNSKQPICPSCKSTLVIQTDDLITPDNDDNAKKYMEKNISMKNYGVISNLHHSASQSSIGTATSLDDSRESTPSTGTITKKCESDIEILSNPSQSSIEILDDGSKSSSTPNRKRSSEERRIAVAPTLLTIPDTTPVMTGLTESSSSGSLTDSICTAYENKQIKTLMPALTSEIYSVAEPEQTESIESIDDPVYTPVVNLTSMLGGLLQSMKITHKELPGKFVKESNFIYSDIQYSYTNFKSVDHRIKLHLILNVFESENEELVLLLRSDILIQDQPTPFPGCFVLSTSKIYILRVIGAEGEDPQRWLQKELSWTMDRLRNFSPLPFKQGVLIDIQQPNKYSEESANLSFLCILQDFQRTSNFLFYLNDLPLPASCEMIFSIPESCTTSIHDLMMSSKYYRDDDAVRIFALLSSVSLKLKMNSLNLQIGGLLVTTSSLILIEDKLHWLLPQSNEAPSKLTEQPISNLIEVMLDELSLALNFFDEITGTEELWTLKFISVDAVNAVINAIQLPWEQLFSVPFQIINKIIVQSNDNQEL